MIVIDASIVAKLFLDEEDSPTAQLCIEEAFKKRIALCAPNLLVQEALSIAIRWCVPAETVLDLIATLAKAGLRLHEPTREEYVQAVEIATSGNRGHGRPQLEDSIYHAMAIRRGGTFVTADKRHFRLAVGFGSMTLLSDWQP